MPQRKVSATTTAGLLVAFNPRRTSLLIQNIGADFVLVSENSSSIATDGVKLVVNGSISYTARNGDEPWVQLFVQANSGTQSVIVVEGYNPIPERLTRDTYDIPPYEGEPERVAR